MDDDFLETIGLYSDRYNITGAHFSETTLIETEIEKKLSLADTSWVKQEGENFFIDCIRPRFNEHSRLISGQAIFEQLGCYKIQGLHERGVRISRSLVERITQIGDITRIKLDNRFIQDGKIRGVLESFTQENTGIKESDGHTKKSEGEALYKKDLTTQDLHINDPQKTIYNKHVALILFSPLQIIGAIANVALLALRIVTFANFWLPEIVVKKNDLHQVVSCCSWKSYSLSSRCYDLYHDIARIVVSPLILIGLLGTPIYGLSNPEGGRKIYATLERLFYHSSFLATCFQPNKEGYIRYPLVKKGFCGNNNFVSLMKQNSPQIY